MYAQFNPEHSAIAKRILSKSKPNKAYIPQLKIYWYAKNGNELRFWEPGDKTIKTTSFEEFYYRGNFRSSQREIKTSYFRYYPKYNALECGMLTINGLRKQPDEIRDWEFHPDNETYPHFMIFYGDPYPYGPDGNEVLSNPKDRYYNTAIYHLLYTTYSRYQELNTHVAIKHKSVLEFLNCNSIILYHSYHKKGYAFSFAENYYKKYAPRPINQKNIDIIKINDSLKEKEVENTISPNLPVIAWCENINGYAVIRCFPVRTHTSSFHRKEIVRFYIAPDKTITTFYKQQPHSLYATNYIGEYQWEKVNGSVFSYVNDGYSYDLRNFESISNLPQLKYLRYTFSPNDKNLVNLMTAFSMLRHPILEQLYKAGYPKLTKICCGETVNRNIKCLFGDTVTENKSLTLYQNLGVNRVILKKMEEMADNELDRALKIGNCILPMVKEFCGCNVRALDVKSLNDWLDFSQEFRGSIAWIYYQYTSLYKLVGRYVRNFNFVSIATEEQKESCRKEIRHLFRLWRKEHTNTNVNGIHIWKDIIKQLITIDNELVPQNINLLSIHNYQDLINTHDYLIGYSNSIKKMALDKQEHSKRFKEMQKIRKEHYEVTDNSFSILVPEHLSQIVDEGITLHHCVKTYIDMVASGQTTILFLRRADDKGTPFYTIEVKNGEIVQIHGFGNKWVGNDLDAARFMYRYCKCKNIHCDMKILTNKGHGYSPSRQDHWEPNDIISN